MTIPRTLPWLVCSHAGHDVVIPANVGMGGERDSEHFMFAIRNSRVLLTHNHHDFDSLHNLVLLVGGHHPGILVVRRDNDVKRDMKPQGIVAAIRKLLGANLPLVDELIVLNHWR